MNPFFLVLIDLSPAAHRAALLAGRLAAACGGQLLLLHVENQPLFQPEIGMVPVPVPEEYYTQERTDIEAALRLLAAQLPVPATVAGSGGSLPDVLSDLIHLYRPQLVVMALAAEHDALDAMLLNQALPALRDTGLPLLLVPEDAAQDPTLPHLVAVAADGEAFRLTPASQVLAPLLARWATAWCVVHVAPPDTPADAGLGRAEATVRASGLLPADAPISGYEVQLLPSEAGLVQAAADVQADVLVLLVRPRTLFSSVFGCGVAAHLAHTCPVPLLLLPAQELNPTPPAPAMPYLGMLAF